MKENIYYFLNAIYYTSSLLDILFQRFVDKRLDALMLFISNHCLTANYKEKALDRINKRAELMEKYWYNKDNGKFIHTTNFFYGTMITMCFTPFSLCLGIPAKFYLDSDMLFFIAIITPIWVAYKIVDDAVWKNNNYQQYFTKFEKRDEQWHRKWKIITILFNTSALFMPLIAALCIGYAVISIEKP